MRKEFTAALRALRARPAFSAAVVATLAIAIGASTAVFNVVDRLLIRPLAFPQPDEIVYVERSWPLFIDGARGEPAHIADAPFRHLARYEFGRVSLTGGRAPLVVRVARVSDGFFAALGVRPSAGRILAGNADPGAVVLSAGLRRSLFADDSIALGQRLQLNGRTYTVAAVMPADFSFHLRGETAEAWVPFADNDGLIALPQEMGSGAIARLEPGIPLQKAQAAMDVAFRRIAAQSPQRRLDDDDRIRLVPLSEHWFGAIEFPLLMLLGAAGCLVLIASANATGLMLARAAATMKETAIRAALGADRGQLVRESLIQSVMLGVLSAAAGLVLAYWGAKVMIAASPVRIPIADGAGLGMSAVAFALCVALLAAAAAGLVSAWKVFRSDLTRPLTAGTQHGVFVSAKMRRGLVAAQVAITVTLLINAGLLLRSFALLRGEDVGFDARNVLTMEVAPVAAKHPDMQARLLYYQRLVGELREHPAAAHAAIVNFLPLHSGSLIIPVGVPGGAGGDESFSWTYRVASPDYFRAMAIPIRAGRAFTDGDRMGAPMVAILDESSARALAGGNAVESVLGRRITLNLAQPTTFEVVGIAGDIRQQGLGIASQPGFYLSAWQRPPSVANLVVRTSIDARAALSEVRRVLQRADPELAVGTLRSLGGQVGETISRRRFVVLLSGVLGAAALALSVLGLGALMSQLVTYRTHEIGVRIALGARAANVLGLVVRQGVGIVGIGLAAGIAGAAGTAQLIAGLLYGVAAHDPLTFVLVPMLIVGVTALACAVPARRALGVDPMLAMRSE